MGKAAFLKAIPFCSDQLKIVSMRSENPIPQTCESPCTHFCSKTTPFHTDAFQAYISAFQIARAYKKVILLPLHRHITEYLFLLVVHVPVA